jgi:hypothetical protein
MSHNPARILARAFVGLGALVLSGCIATTTSRSAIANPAAVSASPQTSWRVVPASLSIEAQGPRSIGWVVRFLEEGGGRRSFFSVRNLHHQELGLVDTLGRAWKFEPFTNEPNWLGSGSVPDGVSRILSPGSAITLVESPLFEIETPL